MKRLAIVTMLLVVPGVALAGDDGTQPLNPLDPIAVVTPVTIVQGDGVKVGEGTSIYPQVGLETGYVSNVFYTATNTVGAGLLRMIVEVGAGSLSPQRRVAPDTAALSGDHDQIADQTATINSTTGSFQYSANLYATWEQYLSDNNKVTDQGGLGLGAYFRGTVDPGRPFSLFIVNSYDRVIRAANFESSTDTNRDIDRLQLQFNYQPHGRTIGGLLRYTSTIDVFEQDQFQFADRSLNTLALRVNWRFLPVSQAYVEVSESLNTGIGNDSTKASSYPLLAVVGLNTALTVNTSLITRIGYTHGFYSEGPDYSSVVGGALFEYRYSPTGKFRFSYEYDHADSINANFYRDHAFQAWFEQRVSAFSLFAAPMLRLREYEGILPPLMGPSTRNDVIFAAWAGARYDFRQWITATVQYRLTLDETDYRYEANMTRLPDPSYVRHELLFGVRVAY